MVTRLDVKFDSQGVTCAAWLYLPDLQPAPIIVMGHGTGGIRSMRLDAFADRFAAEGYACLVFDYRSFGDSGGQPRQIMNVAAQLDDWRAAITYACGRDEVDSNRLVLWGTSFSGGLVLDLARHIRPVSAVIAQCPFTDGVASAAAVPRTTALRVLPLAFLDQMGARVGRKPLYISTAGRPGATALMTSADSLDGYLSLVPANTPFINQVAARIASMMLRYRPGLYIADIPCPVLFNVCQHDTVAPAPTTLRYALTAEQPHILVYPAGHFDVYLGDMFERIVGDQIVFLRHTVPTDSGHLGAGTQQRPSTTVTPT